MNAATEQREKVLMELNKTDFLLGTSWSETSYLRIVVCVTMSSQNKKNSKLCLMIDPLIFFAKNRICFDKKSGNILYSIKNT